ncbi:conserved domain protein [Streptococcus oralis SK255]|uniref:Conserved domain protein n=1 Tax=Streptococcus oralis SK255 TaxID=1005704 RepID=F5VTY0_STROR|nr:conserved domain protein [Streptococcus oralis SK255]
METTKTVAFSRERQAGFIGHNFGDYKNPKTKQAPRFPVLSVTILETTKTDHKPYNELLEFYRSQFWRLQKLCTPYLLAILKFYRSQFWRLQKHSPSATYCSSSFIGHNFGDYKNLGVQTNERHPVLSVTILETTKTSNSIS